MTENVVFLCQMVKLTPADRHQNDDIRLDVILPMQVSKLLHVILPRCPADTTFQVNSCSLHNVCATGMPDKSQTCL